MRPLPILSSLAVACALACAGCHAEVEPETPVGYAEITYAPVPVADAEIETYPHTWYDDRPVYLVNGRWWYRSGDGRWAYYQREPEHLRRTRTYVQQAPPAERYENRGGEYRGGEFRSYQAPPASAPPAVRVR